MIIPEENGNDHALNLLLTKQVDAVWIYADQAAKFNCEKARKDEVNINWDCDMWDQFGTTFSYIHTGFMDQNVNGTTLTMSRKGSGLNEVVNPCIDEYMKTKEYYDLCKSFDGGSLFSDCFPNEHFTAASTPASATDSTDASSPGAHRVLAGRHPDDHHWFTPTNKLKTTCSDGYCPC